MLGSIKSIVLESVFMNYWIDIIFIALFISIYKKSIRIRMRSRRCYLRYRYHSIFVLHLMNDKDRMIAMIANSVFVNILSNVMNISNIRINEWIMNMNTSMNIIFFYIYEWINTFYSIWMNILNEYICEYNYEYFRIHSHSVLLAVLARTWNLSTSIYTYRTYIFL